MNKLKKLKQEIEKCIEIEVKRLKREYGSTYRNRQNILLNNFYGQLQTFNQATKLFEEMIDELRDDILDLNILEEYSDWNTNEIYEEVDSKLNELKKELRE